MRPHTLARKLGPRQFFVKMRSFHCMCTNWVRHSRVLIRFSLTVGRSSSFLLQCIREKNLILVLLVGLTVFSDVIVSHQSRKNSLTRFSRNRFRMAEWRRKCQIGMTMACENVFLVYYSHLAFVVFIVCAFRFSLLFSACFVLMPHLYNELQLWSQLVNTPRSDTKGTSRGQFASGFRYFALKADTPARTDRPARQALLIRM